MIIQEYKELDGIKIFHKDIDENHLDYNSKGLDNLYFQEEKHFWFLARKEFILQNFNHYISKDTKIIEIGAGTGNVARYLSKNGYKNVSVGEMHLNGLKYAKGYGVEKCYQFNLLDTPFENEFDIVNMFDVLEHIEDDDKALVNVYKMLSSNGMVAITVPSHMWLWSRGDVIAGHKIRYTKNDLINKLKENGFEIVTARYFFISITPLLYLRTILNNNKSNINNEEYNNDISMNPILSNILYLISKVENKLNKYILNIFGGSLFIIARKIDK